MGPLIKGQMDQETKDFIKFYSSKWRSKSIFQVLLRYRAARYQDLVQLSQQVLPRYSSLERLFHRKGITYRLEHRCQVHLYNQSVATVLERANERVPLGKIDPGAKVAAYINEVKPPEVHKLPFDMQQELQYFDTSYMNDPSSAKMKRAG